jgi:hypothetical protein
MLFQLLNYAFLSLKKIRPIGYFEYKCACSETETDEIFCCIEQGTKFQINQDSVEVWKLLNIYYILCSGMEFIVAQ